MGSLEEERLVQMVHDFIESSESSQPILPRRSNMDHQANYFTLKEILGCVSETENKVIESLLKNMRNKRDVEKTSALKKWLAMMLQLDGFNSSFSKTSWVTSFGCPAGDYEYIDITYKDKNNSNSEGAKRLIVDIDFRSQFELARPTKSYKQLTDMLPPFFAGSEEKLNKIISLLCSAAKQSLKENGLHVPPWRTSTYMRCKWCSKKASNSTNDNMGHHQRGRNVELEGNYKNGLNMWAPPVVNKPKNRGLGTNGGSSGLSSQFSNLGINCC